MVQRAHDLSGTAWAPRRRTWLWFGAALLLVLLAAVSYVAGRRQRGFCLSTLIICGIAATVCLTLAFYEIERSLARCAGQRLPRALLETFKRILVLLQLLTAAVALGAIGLWWCAARIPGS
ncbi:MAG TPA: hypothetical protein VH253_04815 [Phycisphaerae bacterium]|nr:hypothetical protein [Phycisphaerae bacterium]